MSYVQEFSSQLKNKDLSGVLHLWEEYCCSEEANVEEFIQVLSMIEESDLAAEFGKYVELALPLWQTVQDSEDSYRMLSKIIDLQTSNSPQLADTAYEILKNRYSNQEYFGEKIRLIGLRNRKEFQGAIRNYDLLTHLNVGKFVFHTGGWGTGEVLDYSLVREEIVLEFEYVVGKKYFTFKNAFKQLTPLASDHFLARRFGDPDALEAEARQNPVSIIHLLLKDLGSKTAADIKEELSELVIPTKDWTKWWQSTRSKLKKDTHIETPKDIRSQFKLRDTELSHEDQFLTRLSQARTTTAKIQTIYNFSRDFSEALKKQEVKDKIQEVTQELLASNRLSPAEQLQTLFFGKILFDDPTCDQQIKQLLQSRENLEEVISQIEIVALKKRALIALKEYRPDWVDFFLAMLFTIPHTALRDYLLKSLNTPTTKDELQAKLSQLLDRPDANPEVFVWYFQKILADETLPLGNKEGRCQLFEHLFILLHKVEGQPAYRDLVKKIYQIISGKRFAVVREIIEGTSIDYVKEFLLLVSKCHTLNDHDVKICHSLAEVVHPSLGEDRRSKDGDSEDDGVIWTTQEGFDSIKKKIEHIGTIETVENAREIEAARALGDLRENSEYKFALERRSRLQSQLKMYTEQLNRARVITEDDIHTDEAGIGCTIELEDSEGKAVRYTLLGPWDANPEDNILSFQSKLAMALRGNKRGDTFEFGNKSYNIKEIRSYLAG